MEVPHALFVIDGLMECPVVHLESHIKCTAVTKIKIVGIVQRVFSCLALSNELHVDVPHHPF
jgi:hypothetical protein